MAQRICSYYLSILVGILLILPSSSRPEGYKRTVINDPSISRRCEFLTEKRQEKIFNKQRLLAMIERNKHLQEITPENKVSVKKKLELNLGYLQHELILIKSQIQFHEENIVRKGCPGMTL